jgi:hypothetical protein
MMTATEHPLVKDYLARLREEARRLPVDQARELESDIAEHLDAGLGADPGEAAVRDALDRLGQPAELVAEAGGTTPTPAPAAGPEPRPKPFASPVGAIACLLAAELLSILVPVALVLWVVGLVLLVRATVWTEREKLLGFLGLGTGFVVFFAVLGIGLVAAGRDSGPCIATTSTDGGLVSTTCTGGDGGIGLAGITVLTLLACYLAFQVFTIWRLTRSMRSPAPGR